MKHLTLPGLNVLMASSFERLTWGRAKYTTPYVPSPTFPVISKCCKHQPGPSWVGQASWS